MFLLKYKIKNKLPEGYLALHCQVGKIEICEIYEFNIMQIIDELSPVRKFPYKWSWTEAVKLYLWYLTQEMVLLVVYFKDYLSNLILI